MPATMQSIVMLTRLPLRLVPHRTLHPVDTLIRCWETSRAFRVRDPGEMNKTQAGLPARSLQHSVGGGRGAKGGRA
jgi:hypothetical protein